MKKVLITGSNGCIGSNLCHQLLRDGYHVRAFHRRQSNICTLSGLEVEHVLGDIRDKDSIVHAMRGCETVFHTAAIVSFWKRRREEQFDINVNGTRNVVEACLESHIEKLIHTSSVAALGHRTDGQMIDEKVAFSWGEHIGYKYSKHLAELEVLKGVARGLNATIVNPTVVIGPRDVYVHGGQIVRDVKRGRVPAYISGGMNIVNVHDVVKGHISALEKGGPGERYILGGVNLTHREVFAMAAKIVGGRAPFLKAPVWLLKIIARASDIFGVVTDKQPWITSDLVSGAGMKNWYSSEKAQRELGYQQTSIEEAMKEAFEWYVENEMI